MKTNDEILKYLAGMLTEEEKKAFELELQKSPLLRKELDKKASVLSGIKALGNTEADSHYFENLLPQLRQKLNSGKGRSFRLYPRLAYVIPVLAVIAFFVFKPFIFKPSGFNPFYKGTSGQSEFTKTVSQMNDETKTEVLSTLMENETGTIQAEALPESAAEAVENTMGEELYKESDSKGQYLDNDELINTISSDEAESIYQNMINKKIL
ncbi:MAG: hypothetical protein HF300_09325 [Ignavibacteria bacterium]|jgi:hypothetical protein|nr:hypothetical protein [Ignavibacteria bacterium]MCU7501309.1 hypothetical protein [Ignavibacteria bacterium]MCU7512749.1 hypothetical protein [Ignavibacteria bacterium]MCU7520369.1 hypothetical protein [Ignavibacteria bacterium]MCU7523972.1 hypothetical protein [Ignavibacteria bacterium]